MTDQPSSPTAPQPPSRRPSPGAVVGWGLIAALTAGAVAHQVRFWRWFIEDAAISFAFARNWAWGEGIVATPGGERLEGYSNPTWVALLALGEWLGVSSFDSARWLQVALVVGTVPLTAALTREASAREDDGAPWLAAAFLATSATFAIWGASGLENALFNFLVAAALWRSALDLRHGGRPWAALLWCLLAMTRPEAILYCAIAGALTMAFTLHRGLRPTLQWLALFFVPFLAYHAVRFSYFAYEFPQTYYGKLTTKSPRLTAWGGRGWQQVREWADTLWTGYYLPIYLLGLIGPRGWRLAAVAALSLTAGVWLLLPEALGDPRLSGDFPRSWSTSRPYAVALLAVLAPLLAVRGGRGWQVRALTWGVGCGVLFFAVYSMGDWMKAYRWMSLLQVPAAVLFAVGVARLADAAEAGLQRVEAQVPGPLPGLALWGVVQVAVAALAARFGRSFGFGEAALLGLCVGAMLTALGLGLGRRRLGFGWGTGGWAVAAAGALVTVWPNLQHTHAQNRHPETGPHQIKKRVEHTEATLRTLDIDHRVVNLDVDQGAHLWWGRDRFQMMDLAGLVDIPLAQHRFQHDFFREYVFVERRPHVAHVHGAWASQAKVSRHPEWARDYVEIPGYGGRTLHIGNHVRRDLLFAPDHPRDPARSADFGQGFELLSIDVPAASTPGSSAWLRVALRTDRTLPGANLPELLVFAARDGQVVKVWSVPLLYGWLEPGDWRPGEVFVGGYPLPMDAPLEPGVYDLGVVVVSTYAEIMAAGPPETDAAPLFAAGEVVFPGALELLGRRERADRARQSRVRAIELAELGRCEDAEQAWRRSRWHRAGDWGYVESYRPEVEPPLARCWAARGASLPEAEAQAVAFEQARLWSHREPALLEAAREAGQRRYEAGRAAFASQDWELAYAELSAAVRIDPTRAWARRYAEQARAERLGLRGADSAPPPAPPPPSPRDKKKPGGPPLKR